jgi:hypothetical protein
MIRAVYSKPELFYAWTSDEVLEGLQDPAKADFTLQDVLDHFEVSGSELRYRLKDGGTYPVTDEGPCQILYSPSNGSVRRVSFEVFQTDYLSLDYGP